MTKKKTSAKHKSEKDKKRSRRIPIFLIIRILIVVISFSAIWFLWLDHRIKSEFEGKRWSLPARVYASAFEVYVGQQLSLPALEKKLRSLGYQQHSAKIGLGQYRRSPNTIELIKRSFVFWDGENASQHIKVSFAENKVIDILAVSESKSLGVFRLDPQLIGKIYPQHNQDRVVLPYSDVPPGLIDALVAVEDKHFFSHSGLDFRGIARALYVNVLKGRISQGGSTLTQQLIKNFFLSHERTYWRKFNEMVMALLLERRYSKADILSAYVNEVYLGQHGVRAIHGFGTASEYYFAKPLNELNFEHLALLVGLVKGASYYNPYKHPQRALKRRNLVLQLMQNQNYPQTSQLKIAQSKPLGLSKRPNWSRAKYPAFLDLVKRQLLSEYKLNDLRNEGLRIFTTINPDIQDQIEQSVESDVTQLEKQKKLKTGSLETSVVIMNIASGEILALIGGRERDRVSFNRAIDAKRPIGSLIKPVIFYTALNRPSEYNILSQIDDATISIKQDDGSFWEPRNYDRNTHENVTLMDALSFSYNQATVRLGLELGLKQVIEVLQQTGFEDSIKPYPSLFLGAIEMNALQVTQLYQVFANGGFQIPYKSIREVLDRKGSSLQRHPLQMNQVLESAPTFLSNFLMTQVVRLGTAKGLLQLMPESLPIAGKTGTTNDLRDSWFAGFGDELVGVVWLGHDNNASTHLTGASGAMRVWANIMKSINSKPLDLIAPEDVNWLSIEHGYCNTLKAVPYIKGYKPTQLNCE
jgi:penicillin-binding protein 1B